MKRRVDGGWSFWSSSCFNEPWNLSFSYTKDDRRHRHFLLLPLLLRLPLSPGNFPLRHFILKLTLLNFFFHNPQPSTASVDPPISLIELRGGGLHRSDVRFFRFLLQKKNIPSIKSQKRGVHGGNRRRNTAAWRPANKSHISQRSAIRYLIDRIPTSTSHSAA